LRVMNKMQSIDNQATEWNSSPSLHHPKIMIYKVEDADKYMAVMGLQKFMAKNVRIKYLTEPYKLGLHMKIVKMC